MAVKHALPSGFVRTGEAAEMLGVSRRTISRWIAEGRFIGWVRRRDMLLYGKCWLLRETAMSRMADSGLLRAYLDEDRARARK